MNIAINVYEVLTTTMEHDHLSNEDKLQKSKTEQQPISDGDLLTDGLNSRQKQILQLQHSHGNAFVQRWIASLQRQETHEELSEEEMHPTEPTEEGVEIHIHGSEQPDPQPTETSEFDEMDGEIESDVVPIAFINQGKTGQGMLSLPGNESRALSTLQKNEFGELGGTLDGGEAPHAFVNGGKVASGLVHWAGGNGGKGNQGVGSITLLAPVYKTAEPAAAGGQAKAWIEAGTGTTTVTRSYNGVNTGANGQYYITAGASARIDRHEERHITSTHAIYGTNILPLETRVRLRTGEANALVSGADGPAARAALQGIINWNASITTFSQADTTANTPGGTTDTVDSGSADFYRNYGPRAVGGTNYANYIDVPPGPGPAPAPGGGGGTP